MALREKLADRVQPHLEPGEQLQQVFLAQSGPSPLWVVLTYLTLFWNRYVIVAITNRSIVVFRATAFKPSFVKQPPEVLRLPRNQALGPASGIWGKITLSGQRYHVHKRFHKDIAAANAALAGRAAAHAAQGDTAPASAAAANPS